jgi:hypothetical protein
MRTIIGQIAKDSEPYAYWVLLSNKATSKNFVNGLIVRLVYNVEPQTRCRQGRARVIRVDESGHIVFFARRLTDSIPTACPGDFFVLDADEPSDNW